MANPIVAPNLKGTLAGVVAGAAVAFLSNAGYFTVAAAFIAKSGYLVGLLAANGLTPEGAVTMLAVLATTSAVNYGVTHWSFLKSWDDFVKALPTTYAEYPGGVASPSVQAWKNKA